MEKIKKITIKDKNYPKLLKQISNPPKTLYLKGEISVTENCFAIVGTRRCHVEGSEKLLKDRILN